MNLDDYDTIPCSAEEYWSKDTGVAKTYLHGEVYYFKLVPKRCSECGWIPDEEHFCDACVGRAFKRRNQGKLDRFAKVDELIKELPSILDLPSHKYSLAHWHEKFARAIVELIEKGKA